MSQVIRYRNNRDPLSLARNLFGFDPFMGLHRNNETSSFAPLFDVKESEDGYHFRADLPGVEEKDLDISLQDNMLTVSGTRNAEERKEGETYFVYERRYGSFSRTFTLPDTADPEAITASLNNGVLELRVGKRAETKPRKISLSK